MLTTQRLIIRSFSTDDAAAFFELTQNDGFNLFPITIYRQKSPETAHEWILKNALHGKLGKYAVLEKSTGKLIGMGGLTPWTLEEEELVDITYRLHDSAWGKGLGMELAQSLMNYGTKDLKLTNITATITPDNISSIKIANEIGLVFDKKIMLLGVATDLYRLPESGIK